MVCAKAGALHDGGKGEREEGERGKRGRREEGGQSANSGGKFKFCIYMNGRNVTRKELRMLERNFGSNVNNSSQPFFEPATLFLVPVLEHLVSTVFHRTGCARLMTLAPHKLYMCISSYSEPEAE